MELLLINKMNSHSLISKTFQLSGLSTTMYSYYNMLLDIVYLAIEHKIGFHEETHLMLLSVKISLIIGTAQRDDGWYISSETVITFRASKWRIFFSRISRMQHNSSVYVPTFEMRWCYSHIVLCCWSLVIQHVKFSIIIIITLLVHVLIFSAKMKMKMDKIFRIEFIFYTIFSTSHSVLWILYLNTLDFRRLVHVSDKRTWKCFWNVNMNEK